MPDLLVHVLEARNLAGAPDSYPIVKIGDRKAKGKIRKKNSNPQWDQFLLLNFNSPQPTAEYLTVAIYNHQMVGKDYCLGECRIPLETVTRSVEHQAWHRIAKKNGEVEGEVLVGVSGVDFGFQSRCDEPAQMYYNPNISMSYSSPPDEQRAFGQPYHPPPQQSFYAAPPPPHYNAIPATPIYVIDEASLSPKQQKKLKRNRRWRKVLTVTGTVCMVLITALGFVFLGLFLC
eukprot:TRINITY_DN9044_c0_g1_i1.p1 TRINITY_DN9044_c0_g1~~TRINITY_DN9044_c0_g1_i1.p1  ORF type:complete len:232 (-),score=39.92 TRINITY_DN9044_c0_g1_i1:99-794(-)